MKAFIEFLYSVFIGIAVALFVGFGIWALHPGPEFPDQPYPSITYGPDGAVSEVDQAKQKEYEKRYEDYEKQEKRYAQRVAVIALVPAVLFFVGGLRFIKRNEVVSEGLALGGVFTAIYALIRASSSQHRTVVFVSVTILLVMIILLAHAKFRPDKSRPNK